MIPARRFRILLWTFGAMGLLTAAVIHIAGGRFCAPHPARIGAPPVTLQARTVTFPSASGSEIHAWLTAPAQREPKGVVVLIAGIGGNRLSMVRRAEFLDGAGYATLLMDLQATGESGGKSITFGWLESRDVLAAAEFLHRELPGARIAIIGLSLGGASTLLAAPSLHVDAVVVESVYSTFERATGNRVRERIGPLSTCITPLLLADLPIRVGISADQLRPMDRIGDLNGPVFVISGESDRYTTAAETRELFARAKEPKKLWLVPGAAHVDLYAKTPEEYRARVLEFLEKSLTPRVSLPVPAH